MPHSISPVPQVNSQSICHGLRDTRVDQITNKTTLFGKTFNILLLILELEYRRKL